MESREARRAGGRWTCAAAKGARTSSSDESFTMTFASIGASDLMSCPDRTMHDQYNILLLPWYQTARQPHSTPESKIPMGARTAVQLGAAQGLAGSRPSRCLSLQSACAVQAAL